jgi:hypothetical protein
MMTKYALMLVASLLLVGCGGASNGFHDPSTENPSVSISELQAVPEQIEVDGQQYVIGLPFLGRVMYMGSGAANGDPLYAEIHVTVPSFQSSLAGAVPDRIWVINGERVWETDLTYWRATGGPKWGPDIYVDIVIRFTDGHGVSHLLRASHLQIHGIG